MNFRCGRIGLNIGASRGHRLLTVTALSLSRVFGVGVSAAVGFGGPESFPHLRQNFFRWSSAVHHGAAICAIDDRPNPPVNELADEKHCVAAVSPFHPLSVR